MNSEREGIRDGKRGKRKRKKRRDKFSFEKVRHHGDNVVP